jgi:hypothetical protein
MTTHTATTRLTAAERRALTSLRDLYNRDYDLFTARELEQLSFIRWLVKSGRLSP